MQPQTARRERAWAHADKTVVMLQTGISVQRHVSQNINLIPLLSAICKWGNCDLSLGSDSVGKATYWVSMRARIWIQAKKLSMPSDPAYL